VFPGVGRMGGEYHIELDDKVEPVIHPPRSVPYSLLEKLKLKLQELEEKDVIQKVDIPTPLVNSLVIVEKRDGSLRLCLDPRDLNKAIRREHHRIPTAEDTASRLSGYKFHQQPLMSFWFYPLQLYRRDVSLIMNLFQLSLSIHKTLVTAFTLRTVNLKYMEFPQMLSLGR